MLLLAYSSTASFDFTDGDLVTLLMNSRANNRRLGVTGLLLHSAGRFLQVLEGPADTVREKFATIEADPRHTSVEVLLEQEEDRRRFPKWSMGYRSLSDPLISSLPGYSDFFTRAGTADEHPVHALLEQFRTNPALSESVLTERSTAQETRLQGSW